jgi:hypothetical protein
MLEWRLMCVDRLGLQTVVYGRHPEAITGTRRGAERALCWQRHEPVLVEGPLQYEYMILSWQVLLSEPRADGGTEAQGGYGGERLKQQSMRAGGPLMPGRRVTK